MTQPVPPDLPEVPAEEVTELEAAAVAATVGPFGAVLAPALASILAVYEATALAGVAGGLAVASLRALTVQRLTDLTWPAMNEAAHRYGLDGQALGRTRARDELSPAERSTYRRAPVPEYVGERPALDRAVRARLSDAVKLAQVLPLDSKANVMAVIGRASSAKSLAEGTVRAVVYGGISLGKIAVARAAGRNLLWVPERDACLHCLAHAGWVWAPGKRLPGGLTYADRPLAWVKKRGIRYPPLHPNCRCEAVLTTGAPGAPDRDRSRLDPAARLAAEARRSVIYGWTDHASQAATLRAADRLLKAGADLPTTVEQRARRAITVGRTVRRPR